VLRPNEMGEVEIVLDTRRFLGTRTRHIFILLVDGGTIIETRLTVKAVSTVEPQK